MNVALCDDDIIFLDGLKQELLQYDCDIFAFSSAEELLSSTLCFDIAFLDIELDNNISGFQIVKALRNNNKKCIISFFTNYNKYAIKGYEYQPFRYFLKTEPKELIKKRIKEVFTEYNRRQKIISGTYNGYAFRTSLDDIYYISISNHVITLHTTKGNFELYRQMKDLCTELQNCGFFRCHRSYMVNLHHIYVMRSDNVFVLDDQQHTTIPIGIRYKTAAENYYLKEVLVGDESI
ncbi:response regulator transcription factor [Lachnospiraceae bacterium MD329]|nr:response regulator transcription factor [Lachnospiraceae bacterium MD329]